MHGLSIDSSFARRHAGILYECLDTQDRLEESMMISGSMISAAPYPSTLR
jgi:hypothetical protein